MTSPLERLAGTGELTFIEPCINAFTLKPQQSNANHPVAFGATPPL
jgi:hypothetical protein